MNTSIQHILIANRGEIAVRILNTLQTLEIESLAIYTEEDKESLHKKMADHAVFLPGNTLEETYLNTDAIIQIALENNVDAIHPGYGFLSENKEFAQACKAHDIKFIGPSEEVISLMGNKVASRQFAADNNIPTLPGYTGSVQELLSKSQEFTYPLIIKASAGGGGKGMRVVREPDKLQETLEATSREAKNYFGDGNVFIEQFIESPRHIEVQILGDKQGNIVHLYERECTIQRRHQKIIEEAPSITLSENLREQITHTAVQLAQAAKYYSAGTVEFIADEELNVYFMEMNTRIQVEHPVTELITGVDLIEQQINIAEGKPLSFTQQDITKTGHAIECRIYAEDPAENFRPSPGHITFYSPPNTNFTRVDSSIFAPQQIATKYDPMIAKVITWGEERAEALNHMREALNEFIITGIPTNLKFLQAIINDQNFVNNQISTNYCSEFTKTLLDKLEEEKKEIDLEILIIAALLFDLHTPTVKENQSVWNDIGYFRLLNQIPVTVDNERFKVTINNIFEAIQQFIVDQQEFSVRLVEIGQDEIVFSINREEFYVEIYRINNNTLVCVWNGHQFSVKREDIVGDEEDFTFKQTREDSKHIISSPIPGTVIKISAKESQSVTKGESLIIVEAMKMENNLTAPRNGEIETIFVTPGQSVKVGEPLIQLRKRDE